MNIDDGYITTYVIQESRNRIKSFMDSLVGLKIPFTSSFHANGKAWVSANDIIAVLPKSEEECFLVLSNKQEFSIKQSAYSMAHDLAHIKKASLRISM